jgi:RNA polymerase sigma-70 factor (ECF subfamily)
VPDASVPWLSRLLERRGDHLRTFLRRRSRDPDEAADLAQEVYLRLLRVQDTSKIDNPEAYLFTVAANLVRERAVLAKRGGTAIAHDDPAVEPELAVDATADVVLDHARRSARLHDVLAELSPKCRAAVVLQYRDGLTYEEIGARLGVSANMVKKYLRQALLHCRRRMERLR